jgi:hypothetical protein
MQSPYFLYWSNKKHTHAVSNPCAETNRKHELRFSMGMEEIRCTVGLMYHATAAPHVSVREKIGPVIVHSCLIVIIIIALRM